jgi:hypothetical protein
MNRPGENLPGIREIQTSPQRRNKVIFRFTGSKLISIACPNADLCNYIMNVNIPCLHENRPRSNILFLHGGNVPYGLAP